MPLVMVLRKTHKKQRSTKDLQKNTLDKKSRYEKSLKYSLLYASFSIYVSILYLV